MIAAVLAVVTSAQATPAERLVQFMNNAPQRGIAFTAKAPGLTLKCKLSYQLPNYQLFELAQGNQRIRYYQQGRRVILITDSDQTYYEYKGFDKLVGPPEEAGLGVDFYPGFLWSWRNLDSLKDAVTEKPVVIEGVSYDTLKQSIQVEDGTLVIRISIAPDGSPKQVVVAPPNNTVLTYDFETFGWPFVDVRAWEYAPPIGYMPGNAPKTSRPLTSGQKVDFKGWKDAGGTGIAPLNKKGIALIVTSAEGNPDKAIVPALVSMQTALDKLGVKVVELHLDATTAPKRGWPVVLDPTGTLQKQLDVPVTPYIFFIDKDNVVHKAWAGYADDQKAKLIKTATDAFKPEEDGE